MNNILLLSICFILGIGLRKSGRFHEKTAVVLNAFIIHIALPALTLLHVHTLKVSTDIWLPASMAWFFFAISAVTFYGLGHLLHWDRSTTGCMMLVGGLGNTSFLGVPMIETFFGKEGIPIGLVVDQLGSFLVISTLGIWTANYYQGQNVAMKSLIKRVIVFPPFIALMLAVALIPYEFPVPLTYTLDRLGQTLAPLALFSVGFQVRFSKINSLRTPLVLGLSFKLLIAPAMLFILYSALTADRDLLFDITIFEAAMPPMITAAILATEHDLQPELASLMVGIGIIVSMFTLPFWWVLLTL